LSVIRILHNCKTATTLHFQNGFRCNQLKIKGLCIWFFPLVNDMLNYGVGPLTSTCLSCIPKNDVDERLTK